MYQIFYLYSQRDPEEWVGWKNAKEAFVFFTIRSLFKAHQCHLHLPYFHHSHLSRLYCVFPAQLFGRLVQWGQILT